MFKKLLIAALAVLVGVVLVSGTRLGSHLRLKWNKIDQWAKEQVPLSEEIDRLKMEVANLKQEDARYFDQVARQQVEVAELKARVTKSRASLTAQESYIKEMRLALSEGNNYVVYAGKRYDRKRVETDIRKEADQFFESEKVVKLEEENLSILEKTLTANKAKLETLALKRKGMEQQLLVLQCELAQQRLKDQNTIVINEGRYGKVSKEIEEARKRFALEKAKSELSGEPNVDSIRAEAERQAAEQKRTQTFEERFGSIETKKVIED
jgi:outer membrane murein-binding lipoprotein Lpp